MYLNLPNVLDIPLARNYYI